MDMPQRKHYGDFISPEEFDKMSRNLQTYVRAVFGIANISDTSEEELYEKLTAEEKAKVSELTKRVMGDIK